MGRHVWPGGRQSFGYVMDVLREMMHVLLLLLLLVVVPLISSSTYYTCTGNGCKNSPHPF